MFDLDRYVYFSGSARDKKNSDFTSIEQVIIIVLSNKCRVDEKIKDLQELVSSCADEAICRDVEQIIQLWRVVLADRYNTAKVIFLANLQEQGAESNSLSAYRFFTSYNGAFKFLEKEKNSLKNVDTIGEIWRMEVDTDDPDCDIYYFNNEMELSNIVCCSNRPIQENIKIFRYMQYIPNRNFELLY